MEGNSSPAQVVGQHEDVDEVSGLVHPHKVQDGENGIGAEHQHHRAGQPREHGTPAAGGEEEPCCDRDDQNVAYGVPHSCHSLDEPRGGVCE